VGALQPVTPGEAPIYAPTVAPAALAPAPARAPEAMPTWAWVMLGAAGLVALVALVR
jgi:hypothetical protein